LSRPKKFDKIFVFAIINAARLKAFKTKNRGDKKWKRKKKKEKLAC
jgi:hypothetical protein